MYKLFILLIHGTLHLYYDILAIIEVKNNNEIISGKTLPCARFLALYCLPRKLIKSFNMVITLADVFHLPIE